jgi:DNA-binding transcriptional ArsR family regulator
MAYQSQQTPSDSSVLAVLADPNRRLLLELLRSKPLPVGALALHMPVSRPAVSQHLKILKEAQLVREHRQGTRHYFGLNPAGFAGLREYADAMWQGALSAFAAYVAEQKTGAAKSRADTVPPPSERKAIAKHASTRKANAKRKDNA